MKHFFRDNLLRNPLAWARLRVGTSSQYRGMQVLVLLGSGGIFYTCWLLILRERPGLILPVVTLVGAFTLVVPLILLRALRACVQRLDELEPAARSR